MQITLLNIIVSILTSAIITGAFLYVFHVQITSSLVQYDEETGAVATFTPEVDEQFVAAQDDEAELARLRLEAAVTFLENSLDTDVLTPEERVETEAEINRLRSELRMSN